MKSTSLAFSLLSLAAAVQPAAAMAPGGAPAAANAEPRTFIAATEIAERIAKSDAAAKAGTPYNGGPLLLQAPFRANMEYRTAPATTVGIHETEAELFVVIEGSGAMTVGGTLVNPTRNGTNLSAAT